MFNIKKKREVNDEPEEEHLEIDFDRIFLMSRIRFGISQEDAEKMTLGQWGDVFRSYKELYNFETKNCLYGDVEKELQQYRAEHQPVTSLLSI